MRQQNGTIIFERCPAVISYASVVGKKEGEGPLREWFDRIIHDSYAGKDTFEQAESELMNTAVRVALGKRKLPPEKIDVAFCGDLLNQCVASSFAMRSYGIPYAGVYGACSTMALAMITAAISLEGGAAKRALCAASSHYCTAERQYRFPLEYGSQRPPTAQWTVTGSGAVILSCEDRKSLPDSRDAVNSSKSTGKRSHSGDTADSEVKNGEIHSGYTASGEATGEEMNSGEATKGETNKEKKSIAYTASDEANSDKINNGAATGGEASRGTVNRGETTGGEANMGEANNGNTIISKNEAAPQTETSQFRPHIAAARLGKIIDYAVTDQNNMGAAMAPAVVNLGTILNSPKTA